MITICYITNRKKPCLNWFIDSLLLQLKEHPIQVQIVIVDYWKYSRMLSNEDSMEQFDFKPLRAHINITLKYVSVLPSFCQGPHRLTNTEYFDASIARNTGFVYATQPYIVFVDDCAVLMPGWLNAVVEGADRGEILLGAYAKATEMVVEQGQLVSSKIDAGGNDSRWLHCPEVKKYTGYASWFYGCSFAMPLEAALKVNGFDEMQAMTGYEDGVFGVRLEKAGYDFFYDRRMYTVESIEHHFTDVVMARIDPETTREKYFEVLDRFGIEHRQFGEIPRWDASHLIIDVTYGKADCETRWTNYNLNALRQIVADGEEIEPGDMNFPIFWWFSGENLSDM